MSNQSVNGFQGSQPSNNEVKYFTKRVKYHYVKILEKELQYFINNIDNLNNGLFKSNKKVKLIKKMLKGFDKFDIDDDLVFEENDILYLLNVKKHFDNWKIRYDALEGKVYPGFGKIYKLFERFFNKLVICYNDESKVDSDNDKYKDKVIVISDTDSDDNF